MYSSFFFNDTATTEIYPLSLHDALPISLEAPQGRNTVARGVSPGIPAKDSLSPVRGGTPIGAAPNGAQGIFGGDTDRKSTRLNSSHANISYAVFCLKKKKEC